MDVKVWIIAVVLGSVAFIGACTPTPPHNIGNVIIRMERSACYGTCPVYSVTVYGNGSVIFEGKQYVEKEGTVSYAVPKEDVRMLVDEFYSIDYFGLKEKYAEKCTLTGCMQVSDGPTTTTWFTVNGKVKTVRDYFGAPDKLVELENNIDAVAKTGEYVKK